MPRADYTALQLKPGAWRNGTLEEAAGRWYDVNQVRWNEGRLEPVGGWQKFVASSIGDPARGMHAWYSNSRFRWLSMGSASKLYVHDGGSLIDITPIGLEAGRVDSLYGLGWGAGLYGREAYGTARTSSGLVLEAATWTFANFGEILLACSTGDGRIFEWGLNVLNKAVPVTNAPIGNAAVFVTQENHVMALGAGGDARRIEWSDQEDRNVWTPAATNTAGGINLKTNGFLQAAAVLNSEYLIFSDVDLHVGRYVGTPFVYQFEKRGDTCGLAGPAAFAVLNDRVVWMGTNSFWTYNGALSQLPCDVRDYVFGDINVLQSAKFTAGINSQFDEVWFFYCSANSVEIDRYVLWNYVENTWSYGDIARTAWVDRGVWPYVAACGADSMLYQHEQGYTANGATRTASVYAESGVIRLGAGGQLMDVQELLPDVDSGVPLNLTMYLRDTPRGAEFTAGPYPVDQRADGYVDARFQARSVRVRVAPQSDGLWKLGLLRADVTPAGRR